MAKKRQKTGPKPLLDDEDIVRKLEEAFKNDFTQYEACLYAGISEDTYSRRIKSDEKFAERMASAKQFPFFLAKRNIIKALNKGEVEDSWKFLQKRQKDIYSDRIETKNETNVNVTLNDLPEGNIYKEFLKKQVGKKDV